MITVLDIPPSRVGLAFTNHCRLTQPCWHAICSKRSITSICWFLNTGEYEVANGISSAATRATRVALKVCLFANQIEALIESDKAHIPHQWAHAPG